MLQHGKFRQVRHDTDSVTGDSGHTDRHGDTRGAHRRTRDTRQIGTAEKETQVGHGK